MRWLAGAPRAFKRKVGTAAAPTGESLPLLGVPRNAVSKWVIFGLNDAVFAPSRDRPRQNNWATATGRCRDAS